MMERFVAWFDSFSPWPRAFFYAIANGFTFYFAAYLGYLISEHAKVGQAFLVVNGMALIAAVAVVTFVGRVVDIARDDLRQKQAVRDGAIRHAYTQIDRATTEELRRLHGMSLNDPNAFARAFLVSVEDLQTLVDAAYGTFETAFGQTTPGSQRIDFEVTFMTMSYTDHHITIPASASRDGRAPRSMQLRKSEPDIYDKTVTADIYREHGPHTRIIENTGDVRTSYQELYPNQKSRIKSSIVYPVKSDANELLGTLVVHCDREFFFQNRDMKYWTDVLEIFASRMALVKSKMDAIVKAGSQGTKSVNITMPSVFF